jgi:hypothetical protein
MQDLTTKNTEIHEKIQFVFKMKLSGARASSPAKFCRSTDLSHVMIRAKEDEN